MLNNYYLFDDEYGIYNYCPCILKEKNEWDIYYCSNIEPFKILDHIAYRHYDLSTLSYSAKKIVLAPSESGWDCIHTCDPSVVQCDIELDGVKYQYIMAYLGCDTLDCTHNQVGLAFGNHKDKMFTKYKNNPFIPYENEDSYKLWGTGQPSIICINKKDEFLLSYTIKTRKEGTYTELVKFLIRDNKISIINSTKLPLKGLELQSKADCIHNIEIAYDEHYLYMVRDTICDWDKKYPSFIGSAIEIAKIDISEMNTWEHIKTISRLDTGFFRNHNAGIVHDAFGKITFPLEIVYTNSIESKSNEDLVYLWSYRLFYTKV